MPSKEAYQKYLNEGLCGLCGGEKEGNRKHLTDCSSCYASRKKRGEANKEAINKKRRVDKNKYNRFDRPAGRERISYIREKAAFFDALFPDQIYSTEKVIALGKFLKGDLYHKNTDGLIRTWLFNPKRFPNIDNQYRINDYFNKEIFTGIGWRMIIDVEVIKNQDDQYFGGVIKAFHLPLVNWVDSLNDAKRYEGRIAIVEISKTINEIKSINKKASIKIVSLQMRMQ